jgi:hypothetical protein
MSFRAFAALFVVAFGCSAPDSGLHVEVRMAALSDWRGHAFDHVTLTATPVDPKGRRLVVCLFQDEPRAVEIPDSGAEDPCAEVEHPWSPPLEDRWALASRPRTVNFVFDAPTDVELDAFGAFGGGKQVTRLVELPDRSLVVGSNSPYEVVTLTLVETDRTLPMADAVSCANMTFTGEFPSDPMDKALNATVTSDCILPSQCGDEPSLSIAERRPGLIRVSPENAPPYARFRHVQDQADDCGDMPIILQNRLTPLQINGACSRIRLRGRFVACADGADPTTGDCKRTTRCNPAPLTFESMNCCGNSPAAPCPPGSSMCCLRFQPSVDLSRCMPPTITPIGVSFTLDYTGTSHTSRWRQAPVAPDECFFEVFGTEGAITDCSSVGGSE